MTGVRRGLAGDWLPVETTGGESELLGYVLLQMDEAAAQEL
jgi:hypothetical protein